jgi:HAD superfamily hydrolase (TIGR01458 family)
MLPSLRAILLDIDGCVVAGLGREAIPGAAQAVARLREHCAVRFVTNTTSKTRSWLAKALLKAGFDLAEADVVTPTSLAKRVLTARDEARGILLAEESSLPDLSWYEPVPPAAARSVLLATEAHSWRVAELREAVVALRRGARLYTLQQNRVYERDGRLLTDLGPVAAFLGYAANVDWENLGKPSALLFETLAADLACAKRELAMVGDDAEFDVAGALEAGVGHGILVRTGKYRPGDESRFDPAPSLVLDSVADLPAAVRGEPYRHENSGQPGG